MDALLLKHKAEEKDLQVKITQLKKSVNKDKKRKKEVLEQIAILENELHQQQQKEIVEFDSQNETEEISNKFKAVDLKSEQFEKEEGNEIDEEGKKISKAEKRRQKKVKALKEREELIKEAEKMNKFSIRNIEAEKIKNILKEKNMKMYEINPDGNCLYAAIAHQLGSNTTVNTLRSKAGSFIRDHADDFIPFITDAKTGETLNASQFNEYCHQLENTPAWGGQPELRALSQALQKRIEVLQAEGTSVIFGEEFEGKNILLAYYRHYYDLGEHYNSVVPISSSEIS